MWVSFSRRTVKKQNNNNEKKLSQEIADHGNFLRLEAIVGRRYGGISREDRACADLRPEKDCSGGRAVQDR